MDGHPPRSLSNVPTAATGQAPFVRAVADGSQRKLAEQVATAMERDIIALGCPVDHVLGNEAQLAQAYGVSRWAMREAIAMIERDGLAEMRRGRNGGLVVVASAHQALAGAICSYLLFTRVDFPEMLKVRKAVDEIICALAARRPDDDHLPGALRLIHRTGEKSPLEAAADIYEQILLIARSPLVGTIGLSLGGLSHSLALLNDLPDWAGENLEAVERKLLESRRRQLERITAADPNGAVEATAAFAGALSARFEEARARQMTSPLAHGQTEEALAQGIAAALRPGKKVKLSAVVATRLILHIRRNGLQPGDPIAPESELLANYGVGRLVLREAIRILERNGFAYTEVGRNGGLYVGEPNSASIVKRAESYLHVLGVTAADRDALFSEIALMAAELAANQMRGGGPAIERIETALTALREASPGARRAALSVLVQVLADTSANSIIQLIVAIVTGLEDASQATPHQPAPEARLEALRAAIAGADPVLARRAMARLLAHFAVALP